jgi:hypothetical protein
MVKYYHPSYSFVSMPSHHVAFQLFLVFKFTTAIIYGTCNNWLGHIIIQSVYQLS